MQRLLFRFGLVLLLAGSLPAASMLNSCSSDKKDDPQPTTGSLAGTVSPANGLTKVTATDGGGLTFVATPGTNGAFTIADLKPGEYTLSFTPASGYAQPGNRSITIVAGQQAAAGTVEVESDGSVRNGTISWTRDGVAYTSTALSGMIRPVGYLTEISASTTSGGSTHQVSFTFSNSITGPGTYELFSSGPGNNGGEYIVTTGSNTVRYGTYLYQTGPTTGYAGRGNFIVTSFDATSRRMSGTFSYSAINTDDPNNVLTTDITNGSFSFQY